MDVISHCKRTDAGVIPGDWDASTVGREFEVQLGKMLDAKKNAGVKKPYIGNRAVQWNRIDAADLPTVPMSPSDLERFRLRLGDILVCEGGDVGRAAIWDAPLDECYYQKALHRLRPLRDFEPTFFVAYLKLASDAGWLKNYVTQTSIAHLPRDKFIEVPIPKPSRAEQRAIATALNDVDALIRALDKLIAKKRDLKQAAMQQLLTGQTRLPGFSGKWRSEALGDCLAAKPEYGINAPAVPFSDRLPTYLRITDISDDGRYEPAPRVSVEAPEARRYFLDQGELVFARTGASVGKSYLYQPQDGALAFAGFLIRIRPDSTRLLPEFLFAYAHTSAYWSWVRLTSMRSGQPGINGREYQQLSICLPTIAEQAAIAQALSDMDAELAALEARRDKTRAIKQGIMQELLTGRIRLVPAAGD